MCSTGIGSLIGCATPLGFQRGLTYGFIFGHLPLALLGLVGLPLLLFHRDRPICRCGRCRSQDYEFLGMEQQPLSFDYRCPSCDRHYRARDNKFLEIASNGSEQPYMRQSSLGRWLLIR
jgi:hypothetical protein